MQLFRISPTYREPSDLGAATENAAEAYGGRELWQQEAARDEENKHRQQSYRAQLVDSPVLRMPLRNMKIGFDPNKLFPLCDLGTVYPGLLIVDDWGILEVTTGIALVSKNWDTVTVSMPPHAVKAAIEGPGWNLHLTPGYELIPGSREGEWTVGKSVAK